MRKVKVLVVRVGEEPVLEEIDDSYEAAQVVVGGYFEELLLEHLVVYINEDGRQLGLPFNRKVGRYDILGPFLVTKADENGETEDLSAYDVEKALEQIK